MSQVIHKGTHKGRRVDVMAGWDPPLQHFFLTVFRADTGMEEIVYSTIDDPSKDDMVSTKRLEAKLTGMEIDVPDNFWDLVNRREDGSTCHIL